MGNTSKHKEYPGNVVQRYKQMKDDEVQMAQDIEEWQKQLMENERETLSQLYNVEGDELDRMMEGYADDKFGEYLVDGAILRCTMATLDDFPVSDGSIIKLMLDAETDEDRMRTTLHVLENPMSVNNLRYATVKDTEKFYNIAPFRCNCKLPADRGKEVDQIIADSECSSHGVCRYLMDLSENWDNMPIEGTSYLKKVWRVQGGGGVERVLGSGNIFDIEEEAEGITMTSVLFCKHGGIIYPETSGQDAIREEQLVTMEQMKKFGFINITEEELNELNRLLKQYGLEDKGSIALFLATCGHESTKGTALTEDGDDEYWERQGYNRYTRGAGYIHVTAKEQEAFYESIDETPPYDRTTDISENYAWEASIWEWTAAKKGDDVIMNDYVMMHGASEEIFLITQYFINGYVTDSPYFDDDLRSIRLGGTYEINLKAETLTVNGRTYRLPKNYEDRLDNYKEAIEIFLED